MKTLKEMSEAKYKNIVNRHIFTIGGKAVIKELINDFKKVSEEHATSDFTRGQVYAYQEIIKALEKLNED